MVLLFCEHVDKPVHVCANTECTQSCSAGYLKRVLNISKTEGRKNEEAVLFHVFTSEQTQQALLLNPKVSVKGRLEQNCCEVS